MPLLADLSVDVNSALSSKGIGIGADLEALGDVERWLSLLADPAPWLSPSQQMRNSVMFAEVSQAIYEVVTARQIRASVESPPAWLYPLVRYWHRVQPTVITFNYDCLVELAYLDITHPFGVMWPSDLYNIPITPAVLRVAGVARQKMGSFSLLKLHGSLSWWYSGLEAEQFDTIYWMGWSGRFGQGIRPLWSEFGGGGLVADKFPMLVPPAATKAPFYRNHLLAAQWVLAAEALRQADELVLMGYSAPVTDLTVTSLIATQFNGDAIVPVNLSKSALDSSQKLGNRSRPPTVIDTFIGADAIDKWTKTFASL